MGVKQRTPIASWDDIPGELPQGKVPEGVNLNDVAQSALVKLNGLQETHLLPNAVWRDMLALTGYFRSFYSAKTVADTLTSLSQKRKRSIFTLKTKNPPRIHKVLGNLSWVDVDLLFTAEHETLAESCAGTVSLIPDASGNWRIWMLRTWLECFDGHGHPDVLDPAAPTAMANGSANGAQHSGSENYAAIVVGGGQSGLSAAGRLQALGLRCLLLEKHDEIGDVWVKRYESLRWHTSKEYGNLPFGHTYPTEDDYMLPTKRIGAGHKAWSEKYGINLRTSTTVDSASWDEASRKWTVKTSSPEGATTLTATHLILAIGSGHATPVSPEWATAEKVKASGFKGTIIHSFNGYHSAHKWAGKRGVVVGTANTGHDIAEDMANAGMETTIVQRNPTFIFPAEWLHHAEDIHYNAEMRPEAADRESFTYPNKIMREMINRIVWHLIKTSPERFDSLEKAGFKLDRFGDIYNNLYVRLGGHYVDIGCSARIAKGEIKVKAQPVKELTGDGILFKDGEEVGADLIVLCTGFDHVFRHDAANIVGEEIADQMDDFWGPDNEGELRGMGKPAGHPNLWYQGGDIRNARWFTRFTALQIQADVLGRPFQPYLG